MNESQAEQVHFFGVVLWKDSKSPVELSCLADTSGETYLYRKDITEHPEGMPAPNSLVHFAIEFKEGNAYEITFVAPWLGEIHQQDAEALNTAAQKYHRSVRERQKQRREVAKLREPVEPVKLDDMSGVKKLKSRWD